MRRTRIAVAAVLIVVAGSTLASTAPSPGEGWLRWGMHGMSEAVPAPIDGMLGRTTSAVVVPDSPRPEAAPERAVEQAPALRPEPPPARAAPATVKLSEVSRDGSLVVKQARVSLPKTASLEGAKVCVAPSFAPVRPAADDDDDGPAGPAPGAASGAARASEPDDPPGSAAAPPGRDDVVRMPQSADRSSASRGSSAGSKVKSFRGPAGKLARRAVNPDFPEMSATSRPVAAAIAASVKPAATPVAKPAPKTVTTKAVATVVKRVS